jgi:hypothetical protein
MSLFMNLSYYKFSLFSTEVESHWGINLHFHDNYWCWAGLHMFIGHTYIAYLSNFRSSLNIQTISWAQVTHACNPSYSRGRDQEDHSSKTAQANSLCILKYPTQNSTDGVAQGVDPEFKPRYCKKKSFRTLIPCHFYNIEIFVTF